jgi:hypothetical protein
MTMKSLLILASALSLVAVAPAQAKSRKHYKVPKIVRIAPVDQYEAARQRALALYGGCVTDEGYGRFNPCGHGSSTFSTR